MLAENDTSVAYDAETVSYTMDNSSSSGVYGRKIASHPLIVQPQRGWQKNSTKMSFTPIIFLNFSGVEITSARDENGMTIGEITKDMSIFQRIKYLGKNRPSYLVYLFGTISFALYYFVRFSPVWFQAITSFFINRAKADTSTPTVVNGVDYTPWFFLIIFMLTLIASYAALVSSDAKKNDHGWDLLKVLLGSCLGLFPKAK